MSFRLIEGGAQPPAEAIYPLNSLQLLQLAHPPERLFFGHADKRADPTAAMILNMMTADALAVVHEDDSLPELPERNQFIADLHATATRKVLEQDEHNGFQVLQGVFSRRALHWARITRRPAHAFGLTAPVQDPLIRDRRVAALTTIANGLTNKVRLPVPMEIPLEAEPTLEHRQSVVRFILGSVGTVLHA